MQRILASRRLRARPSLLSALVACVIMMLPVSVTQAQITPQSSQSDVVTLVNQQRASNGLPALKINAALTQAASDYAGVLVAYSPGCFDHICGPVPDLNNRLTNAGYVNRTWSGENIAGGQQTAQAVMTSWMNSPPHRANILDPNFTEIGVGMKTGGYYGIYWVQNFGARTGSQARPKTTGVFRPSNGLLYLKTANNSGFADIQITFGSPGDKPVAGDWDGNGSASIGVYRNGTFYLRNSNTTGFADITKTFGVPSDQPVVGDWDGNGTDTIGVYRNGLFLLSNSNTSPTVAYQFALGVSTDVPISGDWDGNGTNTGGVFRPSNGLIFLRNSNSTGVADIQITFGIPGDKPLAGDWDGDGIDEIGVYRNGLFLLRNTNTTGYADRQFALGVTGDLPIAGTWE